MRSAKSSIESGPAVSNYRLKPQRDIPSKSGGAMESKPQSSENMRLVVLLERYRTGDNEAFTTLASACWKCIRDRLRRKLSKVALSAQVEDGVQMALLRLSTGSESFSTDARLLNWLEITARRSVMNSTRRRRPVASSLLIENAFGDQE